MSNATGQITLTEGAVRPQVARLEHEVLSPEFIGLLRAADDLRHGDCMICTPPIYESGIVGRMYTRALDCPLCGVQIRRGAEVLVRIDYDRHLTAEHHCSDGSGK